MKLVDLRRHSLRGPSGDITEGGVALARRAAQATGISYTSFHSSPARRAQQTAEAFGGKEVSLDERFGLLPGAEFAPFDARVRAVMETRGIGLLDAYLAKEPLPDTAESDVRIDPSIAARLRALGYLGN